MRRTLVLTLAALAALAALGASSAVANPPIGPPPWGPPDRLSVSVEPAGENCPAGGLRVEVRHPGGGPPALVPAIAIPAPVPPQVFYVCNGTPGPIGPAGPAGPAGPIGPVGPIGLPGPDRAPRKCGPSLRLGVRLYLPARLAPFRSLALVIDARAPRLARVRADVRGKRFVGVPMRGRSCGEHLISVQRPGVVPFAQVWTVRGHLAILRRSV